MYPRAAALTEAGPLRAYDAATGALLWTSQASTQAFAYDGVAFAADGDLYVGDWIGTWRIEALDGTTRWSNSRTRSVSGNCGPAASDAGVYIDQVVAGGMVVTKLDPATGFQQYSSPTMPGFTEQNAPFLSPDGLTVYFSRTQNNPSVDYLYAFEDTGALVRWHRSVGGPPRTSTASVRTGASTRSSRTSEFVRLDPSTGNVTATAGVLAPLGDPSPKTAVGSDGVVYVSNGWASTPATNGRIWAFSADPSQNYFTLNLDRQNQGGPALAQSGTLVACDRSGVFAWRESFSRYCEGLVNSTGAPGHLSASGSSQAGSGNQLVLTATDVPDQPGIFFHGRADPRARQLVPLRRQPDRASSSAGVERRHRGARARQRRLRPGEIRNFHCLVPRPDGGGAFFGTTDAASVHYQ